MSDRGLIYDIRRKMQLFAYAICGPEVMSKAYYRIVLGQKLHLKNPQTFNEKLQWLKLYYWKDQPKAIQCADKFAVRDYVKKVGKEEILNDILFAWDAASEIEWDKLPDQFVLKCNHGCAYNIICKNKAELDEFATKKKLDEWMQEDFSKFNAEPHYAKIKKKIICEKYLGDDVINYNIYCLNGKVTFFSVAGGLGNGEDEHLTYYNPDGSVASFKNKTFPAVEDKLSDLLPEMEKLAEFFAKEFPLVRVDLFDVGGRIILSELTFTPGGALIPFDPVEADMELGKKLDISKLMKEVKQC